MPNTFLLVKGLYPHWKQAYFTWKNGPSRLPECLRKKDFFEQKRVELIENFHIKVKREFRTVEELHPDQVNQIVPEEFVPPCKSTFNVYTQRQARTHANMILKSKYGFTPERTKSYVKEVSLS